MKVEVYGSYEGHVANPEMTAFLVAGDVPLSRGSTFSGRQYLYHVTTVHPRSPHPSVDLNFSSARHGKKDPGVK